MIITISYLHFIHGRIVAIFNYTCNVYKMINQYILTSILSPKSMSKLINVNCLYFIGSQNYTNVLINRVLYQIQVTALLPFFLSILHLLLQLSKIML